MKKALLVLAVLAAGASAFAQGTITFFNNNILNASGATYRAGIFRPDGTGAGSGFSVGLFRADNLTTPLLKADGSSGVLTFRPTGGTAPEVFATAADLVVPGAAPGTSVSLVVRAWETAAGSFAASTVRGEETFTSKVLGGTNPTPPPPSFTSPDMAPFQGFTMVPEPSTYALGVLGIGALALMRRRK